MRKEYTVSKINAWDSMKGNSNARRVGYFPPGMSKHSLAGTYVMMLQRCLNPKNHAYKNYGGRGIDICERWLETNGQGFLNFINDVGERPERKTLGRIDNDGNYEPSNVEWQDHKTQRLNQRASKD